MRITDIYLINEYTDILLNCIFCKRGGNNIKSKYS